MPARQRGVDERAAVRRMGPAQFRIARGVADDGSEPAGVVDRDLAGRQAETMEAAERRGVPARGDRVPPSALQFGQHEAAGVPVGAVDGGSRRSWWYEVGVVVHVGPPGDGKSSGGAESSTGPWSGVRVAVEIA